MKSPRDVVIRPIVSEKSYAGLEAGAYTFLVAKGANKTEIKEAVQQIWNVRVLSRQHDQPQGQAQAVAARLYGKRPDQKRAVVTLAAGDTIEIFEAKGP